MQNKNTHLIKTFAAVLKRFFRTRNIIIISDHKVEHVPLSGLLQVLLLIGVIGFFSGASYITGSYMTARSALKDKDQKIVTTTLEKVRIGEEMDLLKRDLVKLSQNGKELSSYSKFIVDQYTSAAPHDTVAAPAEAQQFSSGTLFGQSSETLLNRISYLEKRINEIKDENDHLVSAIHERTDKKIAYLEDIINMTGLDSEHLERQAAASTNKSTDMSNAVPVPMDSSLIPASLVTDMSNKNVSDCNAPETSDELTVKKDSHLRLENQGGPFIPADSSSFNDVDRELLANVDRLVLLHDIVEQLPLRQPVLGAQVTGPFGKRIDPLNGRWAIHPGIDLAGPVDAHILSASAGKVVSAGRRIAYGNMVDIDHGFGIITRYAHMSKILVHEGQLVHKGQQIGVQGSTGRSTGPHLHYEVRINDRPVNPAKFLHAGEYVLEN